MNTWLIKPEVVNGILKDVIPEEKVLQPLYDENSLREEIERQKDENHKLRDRAKECEDQIEMYEGQLKQEKEAFENYKQTTDTTLQKYTEDYVTVEQKLENLEEEAAEYKAVLQARNEDIQRAEKSTQEKDEQIKALEAKVGEEIAAKDDVKQQYESLINGMKDFETTMSELNQENERLSSEYDSMKSELGNEKKKAKDLEHTLSVEAKNDLLEKLIKLNNLGKGLDIGSLIDSKLTIKENRVTSNGLAEALESALNMAIDASNKKLNSQIEEERYNLRFYCSLIAYRTIEKERYNVLAKSLEKVQGELKEAGKREKEANVSFYSGRVFKLT